MVVLSKQFDNDSIIHIQFGNNQYPINNLKQVALGLQCRF
jgi:hypothetical protein